MGLAQANCQAITMDFLKPPHKAVMREKKNRRLKSIQRAPSIIEAGVM